MTRQRRRTGTRAASFPPTSIRIDPELVYRAKQLALKNRRDGLAENTFSKVANAALAQYLTKH